MTTSSNRCPDCGGDTHVFVDGDKRWLVCTAGCGWKRAVLNCTHGIRLLGAFCPHCKTPPRTSQEDDRG